MPLDKDVDVWQLAELQKRRSALSISQQFEIQTGIRISIKKVGCVHLEWIFWRKNMLFGVISKAYVEFPVWLIIHLNFLKT